MALRKKVTGGPLRRRVGRVADINDLQAVTEVFEALKEQACSPEDRITRFAGECREHLASRGIDPDPSTVESDVADAGFEHPDLEWYCARVINLAHVLSKVAARGDPWTAAGLAMDIGRASVHMAIAGFDREADGLARGRDVAIGARRKKAAAWRHLAHSEANRIWADKHALSASAVARVLQKRGIATHVDFNTLRRAIARSPKKVGNDG